MLFRDMTKFFVQKMHIFKKNNIKKDGKRILESY